MNVYQEISQIIKEADGILIGASNGLSIAEGYNIFADDAWFQKNMGDFREKYGLRCVLHGFSVPMKVEEKWAFVSRLVKAKAMQDEPSEIMKNIYALVKDKEYFVVTSNAEDHFVPAGFEADRVFEMEGKLTQMRCKNRCHDEVYPNQKAVLAMTEEEVNGRVPKELLPKCPKCGGDMEVNWGEMSSFTETKNWKEKAARYQEFIQNLHGKKLVILEFGIGWRNQMIKAPLMQLAAVEPQASYITFNKGEIYIPEEIKEKSIGPLPYEEQIQEFVRRVQEAECIVVGGASGLSAAGGGDFYYSDTPSFRKHFGKFVDKYGFKGAFSGMMHRFSTRNEHWGYVATFLNTTQNAPIREPYLDLDRILQGKDFHILTTNQDTQFVKIYPEEKVSEIQGDHRFFQCSQCCQDETWDAVQPVADMIAAMGEGTMVPDELIPRCPHCGAEMFPWVRGYGNFLQGKKYEEEYEKISKYIQKNKDRKILLIELGVGRMTPMFIQEPFWELTNSLKDAYYISVNSEYQFLPEFIEDKGIAILGDIGTVLKDLRKAKEESAFV